MRKILFNSGTTYHKGGQKMDVVELSSIDVKNTKKENLPWLQVFNCGYRVTKDNIDWNTWTGCVFADIDTKRYYNDIKKFNPENLLNLLYDYLLINYYTNFYIIQISNSGTSYHIMFYFNVEKNELNFRKCASYVQEIIRSAFKAIGAEEIILYEKVIDTCSVSPYQGMYITKNEILYGSINDPFFGNFDNIDDYEIQKQKLLESSDVKENGTKLFTLDNFKPITNKVSYKNHYQRWAIYEALIAVYNDKKTVDENWEYICSLLPEENNHKKNFYLKEPDKNKWYDTYSGKYIKVNKLEEFGYHFNKLFEPTTIDLYKSDKLYELKENQTLGDIDIKWDTNKINHLYARCGLGKTFMGKKYGKDIENRDIFDLIFNYFDEIFGKGVCFISPMKSINRDSFKNEKDWIIIDSDNKEDNISKFGSIKEAIHKGKNICTTWESYVLYEMYKMNFSYVIVDEIHTLYMYDYRVKSITDLKKYLNIAKGIKIIMTGTPSNEINEFNCNKIEVIRPVKKVKSEILFYNKQYNGYIINDIKEWIKDKNHYAIVFEDRTNFKTQEKLKNYGISCDIFNQNYVDTVNYIIENQNIKEQVTAFSVYGQAGINLWVDKDKRFRVYILSNNALGIIQYANRIRNKECIDKVIIPYRIDKIDNDINKQSTDIDFIEAERKVSIINSTIKTFDLFSNKNKSIIELRYGISVDCLDIINDKYVLNRDRYSSYKLIKNVEEYEKQIQLIYNRLISNDFDVNLNYMSQDKKTIKSTRLRNNQFAGQMNNFDYDMIEETNNHLKLNPNKNFLKVCTGTLLDDIEYIINNLYINNNLDFEATKRDFSNILNNILKKNESIKKIDIKRIYNMLYLSKHWDNFYNNAFITAMLDDKWDNYKLTAVYIRSIYNETMSIDDIHSLSDEAYNNIVSLRKVIDDYKDIFIELSKHTSSMSIPNDDIVSRIYFYVINKHTKGRPRKT